MIVCQSSYLLKDQGCTQDIPDYIGYSNFRSQLGDNCQFVMYAETIIHQEKSRARLVLYSSAWRHVRKYSTYSSNFILFGCEHLSFNTHSSLIPHDPPQRSFHCSIYLFHQPFICGRRGLPFIILNPGLPGKIPSNSFALYKYQKVAPATTLI